MYLNFSPVHFSLSVVMRYILSVFRLPHWMALCLLCLGSFSGIAQDNNTRTIDAYSNAPNIYVDYDRATVPPPTVVSATNGLGCWVWDKQTLDKQTIRLWKVFTIPESDPATNAQLSISADNAFRVWMDGQEIGNGSDWRTLSIYELSGKLNPGIHVLAVEGFNDCDKAGVIVGLHVKLADGKTLQLQSDTNWLIVPLSFSGWRTATQPMPDWQKATFIANLRQPPWWGSPKTVAHVTESFPEPVPLWRTPVFNLFYLPCVAGSSSSASTCSSN